MAFTGWENAKEGEEFSAQEIAAHYGSLGPYSLLEAPRASRWGRYPLMVRAVAMDGVEGLFKPGEKVRVFMRPGDSVSFTAFPEEMFEKESSLRPFIGMAEENAVKRSQPTDDEPWTDMFCARDYWLPYCDELQGLEPPYTDDEMEKLYRVLADKYAEHAGGAMISGLYATGAEVFCGFCFALAKEASYSPDGALWVAPWDVVLLFFELKEGNEIGRVATVPLRYVNFYDSAKLKAMAEALAVEG